jgi:hypothetical protein
MKIATSSAKIKILYKITILVLIDKDRQWITCTALLDQCCTDMGLFPES